MSNVVRQLVYDVKQGGFERVVREWKGETRGKMVGGMRSVYPQASRPRPAIDESRRLEVGAGPKGMRLKRGQARVHRLAINERRSLEVGARPKGVRLA